MAHTGNPSPVANLKCDWPPESTVGCGVADVSSDRADRIMATINDLAQAEGTPVSIRHVCQACAIAMHASGVALYVIGDLGLGEPVHATDPVSERVAELQVTLGEGPAMQALAEVRAVAVPDLSSLPAQRDWPVFAAQVWAMGIRATFVYPLAMGAITVGTLEIHRVVPGGLSAAERIDALLYAEVAMHLILDRVHDVPTLSERELFASEFGVRWAVVHQATGMVSMQLRADLVTAFLRLRAHAFSTGRRLSEVADDVVDRKLWFAPDSTGETGPPTDR
jgi:hypothetical protein